MHYLRKQRQTDLLNQSTPKTDPLPSNPPSTASSPLPTPTAGSETGGAEPQHGDPEEVDISQHYYQPQTANRVLSPAAAAAGGGGGGLGGLDPSNISEDQLRQMMLGFDPSSMAGGPGGPAPDGEDPMMKMLTQMLGGPGAIPPGLGGAFNGSGGQAANPFAGGANPFAGGMQPQQQQRQPTDSYTAMWRILHFVLAAGLGLYMALLTGFGGTRVERERAAFASTTGAFQQQQQQQGGEADVDSMRRYFFWAFATAETVLLTSRFMLDGRKGSGPPGMLGMVLGFVPEGKMKSLVGTGLKYSRIFSTVRSDILVCVFVLGICSWLRS